MTAGGSSIPEVQRLFGVLATGRRCAEAGTAFGEGTKALASTASSVVSVEIDPDRAKLAAEALADLPGVELLVGDWKELLSLAGPSICSSSTPVASRRPPTRSGQWPSACGCVSRNSCLGAQQRSGAPEWERENASCYARQIVKLVRLPFPRLPDLFGGPPTGPIQRYERKDARRIFRGPRLNQILHFESIRAQEPDPLSMTDVEFYFVGIRPFESVHPEVRAYQFLAGGLFLAICNAETEERRVAHHDQFTTRSQNASGFRYPGVGIGPDRSPIF